jgi:hypothetical protein
MLRLRKGLSFLLVLGLAALFSQSSETAEIFTFQGKNILRISIETHKTTDDGWTPVVLFLKDLEFSFWMDASGSVFETQQRKLRGPRPLFIIDPSTNELNLKEETFPLIIRSQNEFRTRMQLMDETLSMTLRIDNEKKRATFYLGNAPIDLEYIRAEFIETEPGTHELKFTGPNIHTTEKFIYLESTGTIYTMDKQKGTADTSKKRIWLKKIQ